jgi:curved DNA-binding protein CbpA
MPGDGIELEIGRRQTIDQVYSHLSRLNWYELLQIPRNAEDASVRKAYFELSRIYHPDTLFRKKLGPYKPKMEAIFAKLTEAYEVLSKLDRRREYDEYLGVRDTTRKLSALFQSAPGASFDLISQPPDAPPSVPQPPALPGAGGPFGPKPPPLPGADTVTRTEGKPASVPSLSDEAKVKVPVAPSAEALEAARMRAAGKLMRAVPKSVRDAAAAKKTSAGGASMPSPSAAAKPEPLRALVGSLKHAAVVSGSAERVQDYLNKAKTFEAEGKLVEAVQLLRDAVKELPGNEAFQKEYERIYRVLMRSLLENFRQQGRYESSSKQWQSAALSWHRVCEGAPDDAEAHKKVAEALLESGGDPHRAEQYAVRATALSPKDANAFLLLARILYTAGLKLRAIRAIETAKQLDPKSEAIKTLYQDITANK